MKIRIQGAQQLTSTHSWHQMEVSGQCDATAALPPVNNPSTHLIGEWVGPRTVTDILEKSISLLPIGIWIPDRQSIAQSPYRLNYPSSCCFIVQIFSTSLTFTGYLEIFTCQICINNIFQHISVLIPVSLPLQVNLVVLSYPALSNGSAGQFVTLQEHFNDQFKHTCRPSPITKYIYSEMWCRVVWQEFTNILKDPAASIFRLCGHHILKDSILHSHHYKNFWSHSLLTLGTRTEFSYGSPVQMGHRFPFNQTCK
jgi:hypothetical protein